MPSGLHVVVADDEALARERVRNLLNNFADVTIVAECVNGAETIEAVEAYRPALLILDVQMPEMDGFAVLDALGSGLRPAGVVFVTPMIITHSPRLT